MAFSTKVEPNGQNKNQNDFELRNRILSNTNIKIIKKKFSFNSINKFNINLHNKSLSKHIIYKLYLSRLLSSWADRTWDFAVGLFMIKLNPRSLYLAGIQGILTALLLIILSPIIGKWIQKAHRLFETKLCLLIQNGSVILGGLFVCFYFAHLEQPHEGLLKNLASLAPYMFVVFSISAQIWGNAYTLILEKDWLLAIASNNNQLTDLNAMLRRIDLLCQTIASFACGVLMQYSDFKTALFLCLFNFFSGFCEYSLLRSIYYTGPKILRKKKSLVINKKKKDTSFELSESIFDLNTLIIYKNNFFLPGISFGLLFLTILGFDTVTVGFLTTEKLQEITVGIVSLIAGLFGITATLIYPKLVNKFGILKTGLLGFIIKLISLTLCLLTAFYPDVKYKIFDIELDLFCFLAGITLSRAGLWIADLSINQLIQTETNNPPIIGGVQNSINIIFELFKYSFVIFLPELSQFWILIVLSYVSVAIGLIIYINYMKKIKKKHDFGNF